MGVLVGCFVLSGELLGEADEELRELGVSSSSSSLLPKGRAEQADKLRAVGFNDHEILEAAFVAGFFNYTNRWVSTIEPVANPGHYSHNR